MLNPAPVVIDTTHLAWGWASNRLAASTSLVLPIVIKAGNMAAINAMTRKGKWTVSAGVAYGDSGLEHLAN